MAGNSNAKLKAFRLVEILNEKTDEEHPLNASELCEELDRYNINAERKSIYSDVDVLVEAGYDVIKVSTPSKGYCMGERDFQMAEVRLLIDAVQSAKFITETKTTHLIEKIEKSLSKYQREALAKQVYINNRNKTNNEQIYYIIDELYRAIEEEKRVRVSYRKRRTEICGESKFEERIITVNPYALIWSDDHYYLVGNNQKYDNIMHLRIDRIKKVTPLEEKARHFSEVSEYKDHFDAADYVSKRFNMFSGQEDRVKIRCANELTEVVFDKFGQNVMITDRDEDTFTISSNVAVSDGFISWVMQHGKKAVVLEPESLKEKIIERTREALDAYESND